ncbi:Hypothetical protein I5071_81750 [Sandaracinus amylolyticus]|nr:Hypothetical protein I5071_81750 [Sandaracinus amylolyticus]
MDVIIAVTLALVSFGWGAWTGSELGRALAHSLVHHRPVPSRAWKGALVRLVPIVVAFLAGPVWLLALSFLGVLAIVLACAVSYRQTTRRERVVRALDDGLDAAIWIIDSYDPRTRRTRAGWWIELAARFVREGRSDEIDERLQQSATSIRPRRLRAALTATRARIALHEARIAQARVLIADARALHREAAFREHCDQLEVRARLVEGDAEGALAACVSRLGIGWRILELHARAAQGAHGDVRAALRAGVTEHGQEFLDQIADDDLAGSPIARAMLRERGSAYRD